MGPRQLASPEGRERHPLLAHPGSLVESGAWATGPRAVSHPGRTLMPRILEVRERSMEPTLREGDRIVVGQLLAPRPGRLVVFRDAANGLDMIKRVAAPPPGADLAPDELWVLADNADEPTVRDSRHFGPVKRGDVLGVALFRCWPLRRAGRLRRPTGRSAR